MNELIEIQKINAVQVFSATGIEPVLKQIEDAARSIVPDASTPKGRKEIASVAHKVAQSKTQLDQLGKNLVEDWKIKARAVDRERKKMRDFLDNLKADIRSPLTEWEEKDEARKEGHIEAIRNMTFHADRAAAEWQTLGLELMRDWLSGIEAAPIGENHWQEFAGRAAVAKDAAVKSLKVSIERRETYDAEQAELARLRAEAAEREREEQEAAAERARIEREERIAKEASEAATKAAEAAAEEARIKAANEAREERERVEREKQEAIDAKLAAEASAKRAAETERRRIEEEQAQTAREAEAREANARHRTKINQQAMKSFVAGGFTEEQARSAIVLIADHKIKHVAISY